MNSLLKIFKIGPNFTGSKSPLFVGKKNGLWPLLMKTKTKEWILLTYSRRYWNSNFLNTIYILDYSNESETGTTPG